MKKFKPSYVLIAKWITYVLTAISFIILLLCKDFFFEDHTLFGSVLFIILSLLFFQPLIKSITYNENEEVTLENKSILIIQGVLSILLSYSSFQLFIFVDSRISLWFWMGFISLTIILVIDIGINLLKGSDKQLKMSLFKRFFNAINGIRICHFYFIVMLIMLLVNVYDSPSELDLEKLEAPAKLMITKIYVSKVGDLSIGESAYINDIETIQGICSDIRANNVVNNIRGAEYFRYARATHKRDFYYAIFLSYDKDSLGNRRKDEIFNSLDIQPNGYTTIDDEKASYHVFIPYYKKYKIAFSPDNIKKIEEAFIENKQ